MDHQAQSFGKSYQISGTKPDISKNLVFYMGNFVKTPPLGGGRYKKQGVKLISPKLDRLRNSTDI